MHKKAENFMAGPNSQGPLRCVSRVSKKAFVDKKGDPLGQTSMSPCVSHKCKPNYPDIEMWRVQEVLQS